MQIAALALLTMVSLGVDFYEFFWWVTHRYVMISQNFVFPEDHICCIVQHDK